MSDKPTVIGVDLAREPDHTAVVVVEAPHHAEPVRVIEIISTDYIWNEEHCGFFPVFGAPHAGPPARVNRAELDREIARITPKRKRALPP